MPIAIRALYMLIFAFTFWILTWILALSALVQLVLTLLAGQPNPELLAFSRGFSRYVTQIIEFLTFLTDKPPFPFAAWPDRRVVP
jgi:hypothetical protein